MEKEPEPEPEKKATPYRVTKKDKKEVPEEKEAAPAPEEAFKLKKKSSGPRKQLPPKEEEQPAFAGFKLKKAETVKRTWDDEGLQTVDLKHHEFEKEPLEEVVSNLYVSSVICKKNRSHFRRSLKNTPFNSTWDTW